MSMFLNFGSLPGLAELQKSDTSVYLGDLPQFDRDDLPKAPELHFPGFPFPSFPVDVDSLPQAMVLDPPIPPPAPPFRFDTKENLTTDIKAAFSGDDPNSPLVKQALELLKDEYTPAERFKFFHECFYQGQLQIVEALITQDVIDCDDQDEHGGTPLHYAAYYRAPNLLKIMIPRMFDIDVKNCHGETALCIAVASGVIDSTILLMNAGANLNVQTNTRGTPLRICFIKHRTEVMKAILSFAKAKGIILDFTKAFLTYSRLSSEARQQFDAISGDFAKILELKKAGHVWGIQGSFQVGQLEATFETDDYFSKELFEVQKLFLSQFSAGHPLFRLRQNIETIQATATLSIKEAAEKIKRGETVIFPTGWEGHATMLVFAKNHVYKCNRGEGSKGSSGIAIYEMTKTDYLEEVLQALRDGADKPENKKLFTQDMDPLLGLVPLVCFSMKPQKVGNCSKASNNAAFLAILFEEALHICGDPYQAGIYAKKVYKAYTHQHRISVLSKELENPSPNRTFLEKVHHVLIDPLRLINLNAITRIGMLSLVRETLGIP